MNGMHPPFHTAHHEQQDHGSYRATPRPVLSAPPSRAHSTASSSSGTGGSSAYSCISECNIGLRSLKGMEGLREAELGDAMVEFDINGDITGVGSRFMAGNRFALDPMTPGGGSIARYRQDISCARPGSVPIPPELSADISLPSHDTLLNIGRSHSRNAAELKALLGNSNARLKPNAVVLPTSNTAGNRKQRRNQAVSLEQAKPRSRVELDIILETDSFVQGGYMRGQIKVRIRKQNRKEAPILLSEGKLRVVGFESIPNEDDTFTFYQCTAPLSTITDASRGLYDAPLESDGFAQAVEGVHVLPFAMELPLDSSFGTAKGVFSLSSGVSVRYVAMVSMKVRDADSGKRSIAHFYRNCEIWPLLDPSSILSIAPRPLQASTAKSFAFLSAHEHKAKLTAQLHRLNWIAGQRCHVKVLVQNETRKVVKSCTLTLVRTTTVFKPKPMLDADARDSLHSDPDACQTSTTHKALVESVLEMGQSGAKGHASAKGWWSGVRPGQDLEFSHHILLPADALSVTRGRLLEVEYSIRVTICAGPLSSDIFVTLPIRIINFISIDPPPTAALLSSNGAYFRSVQSQDSSSSTSSSGRWESLNSDLTSGVMHFQDEPPPPTRTSQSDQSLSLFSEESSTSSSMQSLVPLAQRLPFGHGQLRVANPDLSRTELTRAISEASVYSTGSTSRGSGLGREWQPSESSYDGDRDVTLTRRGTRNGSMALSLESDDPSDMDIVLKSVLGDMKQAVHRHQEQPISSDEDELTGVGTSGRSMESLGTSSFGQRRQQKLAARAPLSQALDDQDDSEEPTPRVTYKYTRRSDSIQIPPNLQPGVIQHDGGFRPPIPPRSTRRPKSAHTSRSHGKSSVRGARGMPQAQLSTSSSSGSNSSLPYTKVPTITVAGRDSDGTPQKNRVRELEERVRRSRK
ncbi:hypothetical protein BXZ70DRAFT_929051 [Cristinia sonorae]|uniref:Arrestin C-terminal-like domain-containing protein n=1 Tax=Cristinia sonorae TaxID=1940300 RepID=A0A8K0XS39_9AGAR|nr:hypothetical protein BXZ70DRAFT_929051 [Cristinia sonorae]